MALIGHWPLNGDTKDYSGNENHMELIGSVDVIQESDQGKLGKSYERESLGASPLSYLRSVKKVDLSGSFSMAAWIKVTEAAETANGILSNHNHSLNSGSGITIRHVSTSDYRVSINTGNGSSRTYHTYYGETNIKDKWVHAAVIYDGSHFSIWLDGVEEYRTEYDQVNHLEHIALFKWSLNASNTRYDTGVKINDARVYNHALSPLEIKKLSQGLIAYYPMDNPHLFIENNSDVMKDISGYRNDLIIDEVNPPVFSNDSEVNKGSFEFSQNEGLYQREIISIPTDQMTINLWVKPKGRHTNGQGTMVTKNTSLYLVLNNDQNVRTYWASTSPVAGYHTSNNSLPLNEWSMVSAVWDGENMKIFIDGELDISIENKTPGNDNPQFPISIGYEYGSESGSRFLNGLMNDVRIYATALTDEDILGLYQKRSSFDDHGNIHIAHIEQDVHASRNLVLNGYGEMGDNSYFSSMDFDPETKIFSRTSSNNVIVSSSQRIPITMKDDGTYDRYRLQAEIRQKEGPLSRFYTFIAYYAKDGSLITYQQVHEGPRGKTSKEVKNGDTTIEIQTEDISTWYNTNPGEYSHQKQIRFFPPGHEYPDYTYSNITHRYNDIDGNKLILNSPWDKGTLPAGTPIVNTRSGDGFNYVGATNRQTSKEWATITGETTGLTNHDNSGVRYGATHMAIGFMLNRDVSETITTEIRNMSIINLDSPQTISDNFSVSGIGSINPNVIDQINHNLNQDSDIKQRIKEDGTLEMAGYIIQE